MTGRHAPRLFYGWVLVGASFLLLSIGASLWHAFPVLLAALLRDFPASRAALTGVFSAFVLGTAVTSPLVGRLIDRYGTRRVLPLLAVLLLLALLFAARATSVAELYVSYGLLGGLGAHGVGSLGLFTMLGNWFRRRQATVVAIAESAGGLAVFAGVPLVQVIVQAWGWRGALLAFACGVALLALPISASVLRHHPRDMGLEPDGDPPPDRRVARAPDVRPDAPGTRAAGGQEGPQEAGRLLAEPRFWLLFATFFCAPLAYQLLLTQQIVLLVDRGHTPIFAAWIASLGGLTILPSRLVSGVLVDRFGEARVNVVTTAAALGTVACLAVVAAAPPGSPAVLLYPVLLGLGFGGNAPLFVTATRRLFPDRGFGATYGTLRIANGIGSAAGALLSGLLFDVTGSYLPALGLSAAASAAACAALWRAAHASPPPRRAITRASGARP